jgi:hypothetical protein
MTLHFSRHTLSVLLCMYLILWLLVSFCGDVSKARCFKQGQRSSLIIWRTAHGCFSCSGLFTTVQWVSSFVICVVGMLIPNNYYSTAAQAMKLRGQWLLWHFVNVQLSSIASSWVVKVGLTEASNTKHYFKYKNSACQKLLKYIDLIRTNACDPLKPKLV